MSNYETVNYQVIEKDGNFEIRLYSTFYSAAVEKESMDDSAGFRQVFDYISGNNASHEKISMTVPVINELAEDKVSTEFVMPHKYSEESLPKPGNPAIRIKKNESRLSASVTFSGSVSESKIKDYERKLTDWLISKNIKAVRNFRLARYNPPFTLPAFRRNEIMIDIENYGKTKV